MINNKVTTEAQLGLIGGTMGLLTGFSILSGVEIVFYLFRSNLVILWNKKNLLQFFEKQTSATSYFFWNKKLTFSSGSACHSGFHGLRW